MPEPQVPYARRKKKKRHKKSITRSVFVVARPLETMGPLGFLSDGKVPFCHWGLFISNANSYHILSSWEKYRRTKKASNRPAHGTLFELVRFGSNNSHSKRQDFGFELWEAEWGHISIHYVGTTKRTEEELNDFGN